MPIENKENNLNYLKKISIILFSSDESIKNSKIIELLQEDNLDLDNLKIYIDQLNEKLSEIGLNIVQNKLNGENNFEYKIATQSSFSELLRKIKEEELESDLSPASLQVLTICAYLGASSKEEISFIRGIQSSQSIRSLMVRGLLKKINEKYILSIDALQKLGIDKVSELPEYENINKDFKDRLNEILNQEIIEK